MTTHVNRADVEWADRAQPTPPLIPPDSPPEPQPAAAVPVRTAAAQRRFSRRALTVSLLVVVLGGIFGYEAGREASDTHTVLVVARDVPVGTPISSSDLTTATISGDADVAYVDSSHQADVVGKTAKVGLVKGSLLTSGQLGTVSGIAKGQQLVALPLKPGQYPAQGAVAGQAVVIVDTPGSAGSSADGEPINALIVDVDTMNPATQITVLDVSVDAAEAATVARLASTGNLAVILLPAGR